MTPYKSRNRKKIMTVASGLMVENGYSNTSMTLIAEKAGLTEPTLYQHFKGKEDLLFSIVEWKVVESFEFLNEQLEGITGAANKLRKLIWAHLRFNDLNQDYLTLVLLECRTNPNFYRSNAYGLIRKYAGRYLAIIKEGMEEGIFRKDFSAVVIRDLILGMLDFEAYTVLVTHEITAATTDHDDIMHLLTRMLLIKPKTEKQANWKQQSILKAALRLFAEKGYAGAKISDIAREAGVSDGTVYEYFKNKEDILLSIPEQRFSCHLDQLEDAFHVQDPVKKLRRFIRDHFRLYLDDKNFLIVYLVMIQLNKRFTETRAYESHRQYIQVFDRLIREGIKSESFDPDCNVRVFRNMFLGAFTHMSLRWLVIGEKTETDKFKEISQFTNMLIDAVVRDRDD